MLSFTCYLGIVHTTPGEFEKATSTGHLRFVFEESADGEKPDDHNGAIVF